MLLLPLVVIGFWVIAQGLVIGLTRFYFVLAKRSWTYNDIKPGEPHGPRWYASLNRAYINTLEALVLFAPAVLGLLVHGLKGGSFPAAAVTLAWVFVGARIFYTLLYMAIGYRIWISFVWLAGLGPTLVLYLLLLTS
jgi:uncharacterized MAPEG superfamily protein